MKIILTEKTELGKTALITMLESYKNRFSAKGLKQRALRRALLLMKTHVEFISESPYSILYYNPDILLRVADQLTDEQKDKIRAAMGLDLIKYGCTLADVEVTFK